MSGKNFACKYREVNETPIFIGTKKVRFNKVALKNSYIKDHVFIDHSYHLDPLNKTCVFLFAVVIYHPNMEMINQINTNNWGCGNNFGL